MKTGAIEIGRNVELGVHAIALYGSVWKTEAGSAPCRWR